MDSIGRKYSVTARYSLGDRVYIKIDPQGLPYTVQSILIEQTGYSYIVKRVKQIHCVEADITAKKPVFFEKKSSLIPSNTSFSLN